MGHEHTHHEKSLKNIRFAFFLNITFVIIEIIGGLLTNSLAILSDALHDLGDSISLGLAWYFEKISNKKRTKEFTYGYKRFSLLAALVNSLILIGGSFYILSIAIPRLLSPESINANGMLMLSLLGVTVNGIAALRVKRGKTLNEKVISWHLIEDVLGWIAVFIASTAMLIWDIPVLDPILSILITTYILFNVIKYFKKTAMIFLQGVPDSLEIDKLEKIISKVPKVVGVHDTHVWSLDGDYNILTTHVVVKKNATIKDYLDVKCHVKDCFKKTSVHHVTFEV